MNDAIRRIPDDIRVLWRQLRWSKRYYCELEDGTVGWYRRDMKNRSILTIVVNEATGEGRLAHESTLRPLGAKRGRREYERQNTPREPMLDAAPWSQLAQREDPSVMPRVPGEW